MHDIDRTYMETDPEAADLESLDPEFDGAGGAEIADPEVASPFSEDEEIDLASELLSASSDQEVDQFLGRLFKRVGQKVGRFVHSSMGRRLGGVLRTVARRALPIAGRVIGGVVGGPIGAQLGGRLASTAGRIFGLEIEGLSAEDQDMEVARRFVRFAGAAARRASMLVPTGNPSRDLKLALAPVAARYAPGLLSGGIPSSSGVVGRSGRWIRRGHKIVLLGV